MGENTSAMKRGWHYNKANTRLSSYVDGLEAIRLTPSTTGVDVRLLGDTPATNYINFDASGPSITFAGSISIDLAGGGIDIGSSGSEISYTAGTPLFTLYATSSNTTSTNAEPFYVYSAMTGANGYGGRSRFHAYSNTTGMRNFMGLKSYTEFGTSGRSAGLCSGFCSEIKVPNANTGSGGVYTALEVEYVEGASTVTAASLTGNYATFMYLSGSFSTDFDANGFFMSVQGLTAGATKCLSATSETLRVGMGSNTRYLLMSQVEDTLSIGLTGSKKSLATGVPEIVIWSTSALTSGTQDVMKIDFTQTAAQQSGYIKGLRCTMTSDVKTPGSFNGLKGIIDYSTNGYPWGDCAPVASELIPPNSSAPRGTFAAFEAQIVPGSSSAWNSAGPCSFLRCILGGTATHFDTYGYLFTIEGCNSGAGNFWYDATNGTTDEWIKVKTPSGDRYLMLSDVQTEA